MAANASITVLASPKQGDCTSVNTIVNENENDRLETLSDDEILSEYSLPILPEFTASYQEEQSLLTRSQYALVVFHDVAETYPTDSDIVCRYSLTDGVEAAPGDRVVLFRVGWSSVQDYVAFEWAPTPTLEKDDKDLQIIFKAAVLPKDVNEFYQVCYVSNEGAVCGASVPFQVRTPNNEELTFAMEEDMVVVRSSTAVAQDKLLKAQLERESLNKKKMHLEKQLRSLEDKHSLALRRLDRLQETLSASIARNEELSKATTHLSEIQEKFAQAEKELEELHAKLLSSEQAKEEMQAAAKLAEEDRHKFTKSEEKSIELEVKLHSAECRIEKLQNDNERTENHIQTLQEEIKKGERCIDKLVHKNAELENKLKEFHSTLSQTELEKWERLTIISERDKNEACICNTKKGIDLNGDETLEKLRIDKKKLQETIATLEQEKLVLKEVLNEALDAQKNCEFCSCHASKPGSTLQNTAKTKYYYDHIEPSRQLIITLEEHIENLQKSLENLSKENGLHLQGIVNLQNENEILRGELHKYSSNCEPDKRMESLEEDLDLALRSNARETELRIKFEMETASIKENLSKVEHEMETLSVENERLRSKLASEEVSNDSTVTILRSEYLTVLKELDMKDMTIGSLTMNKQEEKNCLIEEIGKLKVENADLNSRNILLVEQEVQLGESSHELRRLTFMNKELLRENALLSEKIQNSNPQASSMYETIINLQQNMFQVQSEKKALESMNEDLKKKMLVVQEQLSTTWDEMKKTLGELDMVIDEKKSIETQLDAANSWSQDRQGILLQKLDNLEAMLNRNCSQESNLCRISQEAERLTVASDVLTRHDGDAKNSLSQISRELEELKSSSKLNRNILSSIHLTMNNMTNMSVVSNAELRERLEQAGKEYRKLYTNMFYYEQKYKKLKGKIMNAKILAAMETNPESSGSNGDHRKERKFKVKNPLCSEELTKMGLTNETASNSSEYPWSVQAKSKSFADRTTVGSIGRDRLEVESILRNGHSFEKTVDGICEKKSVVIEGKKQVEPAPDFTRKEDDVLLCPFCGELFPTGAYHLLSQHVDNHIC